MLTDRNKQYPIQNKSQLLYPVTKGIIYPLSVIVPNNRTKYLMTGAVTAQKLKFSIKDFFSKCDPFTEEILDGKVRFLCSNGYMDTKPELMFMYP